MLYSDFVNIRKSMNDPAEAKVKLAQCLILEVWVHMSEVAKDWPS